MLHGTRGRSACLRWRRVGGLMRAEPRMLVRDGTMLRRGLRPERNTEAEALEATRSAGTRSLGRVRPMVFETDGPPSVTRDADHA